MKSNMTVAVNGRGTAPSIPWGPSSPLVKAQDEEPGQSVGGKLPTHDGYALDVPHEARLVRFGSWNVGSMTGRSGEIVECLARRRIDVCCVQETRWKGGSARMLNGKRCKYKLFWQGRPDGLHGVGVLLCEELVDKVVEVKRVSERLMMVKFVVGKMLINVVSGYAPQTGRSDDEKDAFWDAVYDLVASLKKEEVVVFGGDLNGHVGRISDGYEGVHGGCGVGERNVEGERILEFGDAMEMIVCGTQFKKDENKLVTYASGDRTTTVDYLMIRKEHRKLMTNAKAIPGEAAVAQHRPVVIDMKIKGAMKNRRDPFRPRIKIWKLKDQVTRKRFEEEVRLEEVKDEDINMAWVKVRDALLKAGSKVCGWTRRRRLHRETWWWNDEVNQRITEVQRMAKMQGHKPRNSSSC